MAKSSNGPRLVFLNLGGRHSRDGRWYIEHAGKRINTGCDLKGRTDALRQFDDFLKAIPRPAEGTPAPILEAQNTLGSHDKNAPIRLALAARLAFPDGSMGVLGLRKERDAGRLVTEKIANKEYTTLAAIERMRELCRVRPKVPASSGGKKAGSPTGGFVKPKAGLSKTEESAIAQAAAKLTAQRLKESLRKTSRNATGGRRAPKT